MTTFRRILTATALAAVASSVAMASSMTESFSATQASSSAPFSDNFTLESFDTTLGTLTAVTVSFAYSATAEVDVINTLGTTQSYTNANASIPLTLDAPDSLTTTVNAVAGPISGSVAAGGEARNPGLTTNGTLTLSVLPSDFGAFEDPPSALNLNFTVLSAGGNYSGTANAGVFFGGQADAGGVTTITYDYTIPSGTPEPATMALMGGALIGLGLFGKKRLKKS